ncbi:hypothetical protein ACH4MM_07845 [Streptomyces pratensis]|uniref:hypothetical protein n=1 Tax=Streptomyces pratensis TaxID=1169025 RepID=UPI0037912F15
MKHVDDGHTRRREYQARHIIGDLRAELASWTQRVSEGGPLEKHASQVRSVVRVLVTALDRLDAMPEGDRIDRCADIVLDLHHLWDFFRSKILLRQAPRYKEILQVTDELAWSLYEPVMRTATSPQGPREPPLTFPSRQPVPFATPRGSNFEDLLAYGKQRTLDGRKASKCLPVPLISLPWSSGRHLPALLAVAHETGHHIEDDFALTPSLLAQLREHAGVPAERLALWEQWLGEAFADICATLACGPAYLWALSDVLQATGEIRMEASSSYPPNRLRILICRAALPGDRDAGSLPPIPGTPHPTDVEPEAVVNAVLSQAMQELGGRTLPSLIGLHRPGGVPQEAERLTKSLRTTRRDVPGIIAAATLAFVNDPSVYGAAEIGERCINEILDLRIDGKRDISDVEHKERRDFLAGNQLFDLLLDRTFVVDADLRAQRLSN